MQDAREKTTPLATPVDEDSTLTTGQVGSEKNGFLDSEKGDGPMVAKVGTAPPHRLDDAPEVTATVPGVDNPAESCETFRAYFLGIIATVVGTALNTWFGSRQPGIYITPLVAQFVAHPLGLAMARILPTRQFRLFGQMCSFNPGPWTIKEHTIVTLMATVSLPTATAIDIIITTRLPVFFNDPQLGGDWGYQILIVLSTQFLGFGLAGLAREYLVYPPAMIWPLNLAKVSLFNALHRRTFDEDGNVQTAKEGDVEPPVNGWRVSAYRFCLYATIASFIWLFVTAYFMPFLTYFNWPTWISRENSSLAITMGSITGFGLNPFPTFDWTYINAGGLYPLITPWWATLQIFIGSFLGLMICYAIYFSNTWYSAYLLPNSNQAFDRFGALYNATRVLTPEHTLDNAAYEAYSPIYFTAGYNVVFGSYFASYTAALVYAFVDHWEQIKTGFRISVRSARATFSKQHEYSEAEKLREQMDFDIHYQLMKTYPEAKQWWFALTALISIVLGIGACEGYNNTMPIWGIFCCLGLAVLFLVPAGIILAVSNVQVILVVLAEIIPGVAIPGRPYANMVFKIYGWIALVQALLYIQDQKLAHYLHVPPRATFRAQMLACLIGSFVTLGIINWQMDVVDDLCTPGQKDLLTCPYYTTFYSSALLFGVVGPTRVYGSHGLYKNLLYAFLVGAGLTLLVSLAKRRWPQNKYIQVINIPVLLYGPELFAPYNFSFVWAGVPVAFTFMKYIKSRFHPWWNKYCYVLSIGLTVGASLSAILQFFALSLPKATIDWWGTEYYVSGCDGLGCPLKPLPDQGYFGPGPGQFT